MDGRLRTPCPDRAVHIVRRRADTARVAVKVFRTELNPVDLLERAAFVYPDKVALVHGERRYTYAALAERAWRLANALRDAGLEAIEAQVGGNGVEARARRPAGSQPGAS